MTDFFFDMLFGDRPVCRHCGKICEGDFRSERQPEGKWLASCDKCNREHDHADYLMGVLKPVPDDGCPF